jgi:hypothetical protein
MINKPRRFSVEKTIVPRISDALCLIEEELLEMHEDIWDIRIEPTDIHYFSKEKL